MKQGSSDKVHMMFESSVKVILKYYIAAVRNFEAFY